MNQIPSTPTGTPNDDQPQSPGKMKTDDKPTTFFSIDVKDATDIAPKIIALGLAIIYLAGFLVLNTHLSQYGIVASDLINVRYLIAGAVYIFYLVCFGVFAGRSAFSAKIWLNNEIKHLENSGAHPAWGLLSFIHTLVQSTFFLCLSAALFSSTALTHSETVVFYGALIVVFVFDYFFDTTNLDIKFPVAYLVFQIAYKVTAVWVFFHFQESIKLTILFMSYLVMYFCVNLLLDMKDRYKLSANQQGYILTFFLVFVLISAISFGSMFYGDVSRKLGGGNPIRATLGLLSKPVESIPRELEIDNNSIDADILLMTNDYVFVESKGKILRINENKINWIELYRPKNKALPGFVEQQIEEKIKIDKKEIGRNQNKEIDSLINHKSDREK